MLVACASLGYHANGTAIVRPSDNSTESVSSVIVALTASDLETSSEELIPTLQQSLLVLFYKRLNAIDIFPSETMAALETNRTQPELGLGIVTLNMDMRRFISVCRVKE
ncbi:MAG: hypothetical protein WD847_07585 [Pirellulales bacterium]